MIDYAMLPPEVNSGRMYTGAGSNPMIAAAAAWDGLAAELSSAASSYRAVISELTDGSWRGSASASMVAAADPYVEWMNTTAVQAEQTASQARAAAAAYEAAFAATVPPSAIAINRATLAALVATNFFGQNTPAIAANQAEYAEMWAQDAAVMYSYAAASAAATKLSPLSPAPQTTNEAGTSAQAEAAAQAAASVSSQNSASIVSQLLSALQNPFGTIANSIVLNNPTTEALNAFLGSFSVPLEQATGPELLAYGIQLIMFPLMTATGKLAMLTPAAAAAETGAGLASSVSPGASATTLAAAYPPEMSADLGRAVPVGKLSVPPSWGTTPQEVRLTAAALPTASSQALPATGMGMPFVGGPIGSIVNTPKNSDPQVRSGSRLQAVGKARGETDADQGTQNQWGPGASPVASGLSDRERDELERLREEMTDLAMDCDAMARLMREAMC